MTTLSKEAISERYKSAIKQARITRDALIDKAYYDYETARIFAKGECDKLLGELGKEVK